MNCSVGTITTLEDFLELDKISWGAIHHGRNALRGKERVEGLGYGRGPVAEPASGWNHGVVPTNAVWGGIRPHEIRSESSGCDLEVIRWVSPSTKANLRIRVEDG